MSLLANFEHSAFGLQGTADVDFEFQVFEGQTAVSHFMLQGGFGDCGFE